MMLHHPRRWLLPLVAGLGALVAAAGLSACNPVPDNAADVNGHTISRTSLDDELHDIAKNATYVSLYEQGQLSGQQSGAKILGASPGTFDGTFVSQRLTNDILYELVRQEVARRHLTVTPADLAAARDSEIAGYIPSGSTASDSLFLKFPARFQEQQINDVANQLVLERALGAPVVDQAAVQAYFNQHQSDFPPSQLCLSVIVAADQATATALKQQLDHGTDFATLAKQKSQDPQTAAQGGDAGCLSPSQLPSNITGALAPLAPGQVSAPIDNGGNGVLLIKVNRRVAATLSDVATQIRTTLMAPSEQALSTLIEGLAGTAHVSVNPRYGTFQGKRNQQTGTFGVVPPALSTVTTAPSADTSATGGSGALGGLVPGGASPGGG
jgi:parvulin-like peptidyl-prolyl isomerase